MKKYRHFPLEYKQRIVQEVESGLRSKTAIAREEKLACSLIDRWQRQFREGTIVDHPNARERQLMKRTIGTKRKLPNRQWKLTF